LSKYNDKCSLQNLLTKLDAQEQAESLAHCWAYIALSPVALKALQDDYPHSQMGKLRHGQWQLTATQQAGEHMACCHTQAFCYETR